MRRDLRPFHCKRCNKQLVQLIGDRVSDTRVSCKAKEVHRVVSLRGSNWKRGNVSVNGQSVCVSVKYKQRGHVVSGKDASDKFCGEWSITSSV